MDGFLRNEKEVGSNFDTLRCTRSSAPHYSSGDRAGLYLGIIQIKIILLNV